MKWWQRPFVSELLAIGAISAVLRLGGYALGVLHGGAIEAVWLGVWLGAGIALGKDLAREQRRARG